jgi:hypothetical protein
MKQILFALCVVAACGKSEPAKKKVVPAMPVEEVQRAKDACKGYVDKACACTAPVGQKQCAAAKAMPEALELAIGVATSPESSSDDAARAQVNVRETVKECIEQTAKLPALGCP